MLVGKCRMMLFGVPEFRPLGGDGKWMPWKRGLSWNARMSTELSGKIAKNVGKTKIEDSFKKGKLSNYSIDVLEMSYACAYQLYNANRFNEALQLFQRLVLLSPTDGRYILGWAACHHRQRNYRFAIAGYQMLGVRRQL